MTLVLVSIAVTGATSLVVGGQQQFTAIGTYSDGSTANITTTCSWMVNTPGAAVGSQGLVTALQVSTVNIVASLAGVFGSAAVAIAAPGVEPQDVSTPTFRSHLLQVLLNYFDWKDVRVRQGRYTIDAQVLNLGAQQLEQTGLRLKRELGAATLHNCPANIDNGGCYWKQILPGSFNYGLSSHTVTATRSSQALTLQPYNDQLPIPTRVTLNSNFSPIPFTNPLLFTATGVGDTTSQTWATQRLGPFTPALPNRLHFWVDGETYYAANIFIRITGQRAPAPAWSDEMTTTSESFTLNSLGWATSNFAWQTISEVQISGLPAGVTLSAFVGMFSLPQQPDVNRPFCHPTYRGVLFDRYWSSAAGFLTEQYLESDYAGWRYVNSYSTPLALNGLAVEPNTWGMFAVDNTTLYYFDRREPLPTNLSATALTQEPLYGIQVAIDETQTSPIRFVVLSPVAYGGASGATSYRYIVQTPDGAQYVLTPNGLFAEFATGAGWRSGTPTALTIPLAETGTYVFSIQTNGSNGIVQDSTPYLNAALTPAASFDLSSLVPSVQGISFDDRNRLWVWTGQYAIALQLHYDAYTIDQETQAIYLTDSVDGLTIDGTTL